MNGYERIEAAINLNKADRIPISPIIIGYAAKCAGMKQKDIYQDINKWIKALDITYEKIGLCDSIFPRWPYDVIRMQMMPFLLPGTDLDDDCQGQLLEKETMHRDDYKLIIRNGYSKWFFNNLAKLWDIKIPFPLCMPIIIPQLLRINLTNRNINNRWQNRGVPSGFDSACYPPFDLFSLSRSMEEFCFDIADCPELIEEACVKSIEDIVRFAKMPLRFSKGNKIAVYPMRSSSSFISPTMFERFSLPYLNKIVHLFWQDGIISVLHCDGNWTPMLKYFLQFPAKSCIVELDEETDIFEAKKILGNHLCIKGNVSSSLLAFGTKNDVENYCYKLIKEVGLDGGFILSSGCEVPINAKDENVKALVDSVSIK